MKKILIFCFILCLRSNLGAVRLYYCFNKNTETVTVSRSAKDPITYRSYVHDIDASNHGIVTIHPLMDDYGIGRLENPRNVEYYPIVSIDDNAFAGCYWITRINIPASIKTIGRNVFMGCENLKEIFVDANNPYFTSDDGVLYNKGKTILIKFPAGKDASSFTIPETVKEIADDAFEGVKMDNTMVSQDEGNPSFDETINYQFNNAQAYIGEILYLMPITDSYYDCPHYQRFKNFDADENDIIYNAITNQYKYDPSDYRDYKYAGTHKRHIEGHEFYVDNVVQYLDYKYQWVFYLTDLNTGDRLKFDYYGEPELYMNSFIDFPFITMKYFNYYKSLIGTNLVFATKKSIDIEELESTYNPDFKDINTGEVVQFSGAYAKWKIKDVIIDKYNLCLTFIVTNGKNTIKIPYNVPYSTKTKQPQYWISKYPAGVRVFPEAQWNEMINKYGEQHMSLIMNSKVSDDMTLDEKYLAGGRRLSTSKKDEKSTSDALKEIGKTAVKSTKETISDGVKIIKSIFK